MNDPMRGALAVAVLIGAAVGLASYTAYYAEAAAYLSTEPRVCATCHIMQPQLDSWQKASHHGVAGCVDCHLPPSGVAKWIAKLDNGYRHSRAFTLQDFAEPIRMTPRNATILQESCLRCHGDLVHELVTSVVDGTDDLGCVHCHSNVGHGERAGLGGPDQETSEVEGEGP